MTNHFKPVSNPTRQLLLSLIDSGDLKPPVEYKGELLGAEKDPAATQRSIVFPNPVEMYRKYGLIFSPKLEKFRKKIVRERGNAWGAMVPVFLGFYRRHPIYELQEEPLTPEAKYVLAKNFQRAYFIGTPHAHGFALPEEGADISSRPPVDTVVRWATMVRGEDTPKEDIENFIIDQVTKAKYPPSDTSAWGGRYG